MNGYGESLYSAYKAVKLCKPDAPLTVEATAVSSSSVDIRWSSVAGAAYYKLYYSTSPSGTKTEIKATYTETSETLINGAANTTFYFFVKAFNALGESDFSPAGSATTFPAEYTLNLRLDGNPEAWSDGKYYIKLRWYSSDVLNKYEVYCSVGSPNNYNLIAYTYSSGSATVIGGWFSWDNAPSNTTFYFYVKEYPYSSSGGSNYERTGHSEIIKVTTGNPTPPAPLPSTPSSVPSSPPAAASAGQMTCPSCHGLGNCWADYSGNHCNGGTVSCWICYGSGTVTRGSKKETCSNCNGKKTVTCKTCSGTGKCTVCNGTGKV